MSVSSREYLSAGNVKVEVSLKVDLLTVSK